MLRHVVELQRSLPSCDSAWGVHGGFNKDFGLQARRHKMEKVMLTCFKENKGALRLYRRLDYSIDESSPTSDVEDPECSGCAGHNRKVDVFVRM